MLRTTSGTGRSSSRSIPSTTLLFGQAATRELPPGSHRLKADNTLFWKTVPFDVGPGEEVRFVVANRKGPGSGILLLVGAPLYYLRVSRG